MIAAVSVHLNPNLPWYVARSAGIVAWALITASVIWGLSFSGKLTRHPKLPSPAWMLDLHRFLGGMAVIFTGLHIVGLMLDKYVGYGPSQVLVPLTGTYRPVAVAWGIVGAYFLLAVELTSLVMSRLPRKVWHGIHLTSFGIFTLVTVHALTTGTDARHGVLPLTMVLAAIVVAMLTGMRAQIAIAKRTERALRAQRAGRAAPGARPVRDPGVERPVRVPALAEDDDELPARQRPAREVVRAGAEDERPVRQRLAREVVRAGAEDERPVRQRPAREVVRAGADDDRPVRQRPVRESVGARMAADRGGRQPDPDRPVREPARPEVERSPRPMVPAAEYAEQYPGDDQFRPPYAPAPYGPPPAAPYADPRYPAGPYADPRYPAGPYAGDPRYAGGPYPDPRYPAGPYADPRYPAGPYPDPRYSAGPYPDPRYPAGPYADPRYPAGPYADPRYPAGPYADPRMPTGGPPDPRYPVDPRLTGPAATPLPSMPPMPAVGAGAPPDGRPAPSPYAPAVRGGLVGDDDVHDAELVEEQAEAVGQTSPAHPRRDADVYPLRPVVHTARPTRPRPTQGSTDPSALPVRRAAPTVTHPTPSPAGVHRVPADGRGVDQRPLPAEQAIPADGRAPGAHRISADGRAVAETDIHSEWVAGRLP